MNQTDLLNQNFKDNIHKTLCIFCSKIASELFLCSSCSELKFNKIKSKDPDLNSFVRLKFEEENFIGVIKNIDRTSILVVFEDGDIINISVHQKITLVRPLLDGEEEISDFTNVTEVENDSEEEEEEEEEVNSIEESSEEYTFQGNNSESVTESSEESSEEYTFQGNNSEVVVVEAEEGEEIEKDSRKRIRNEKELNDDYNDDSELYFKLKSNKVVLFSVESESRPIEIELSAEESSEIAEHSKKKILFSEQSDLMRLKQTGHRGWINDIIMNDMMKIFELNLNDKSNEQQEEYQIKGFLNQNNDCYLIRYFIRLMKI
jgi:hypothetical protein